MEMGNFRAVFLDGLSSVVLIFYVVSRIVLFLLCVGKKVFMWARCTRTHK